MSARSKFTILITILVITLFTNLHCQSAQEPKKLSVREAMNIALENNMDLMAQKLDIDIAKNEIKTAGRFQNPEVRTFWNFGDSGLGNPQQIGLSQTVELFKRSARKKYANSTLESTKEAINLAQFDLKMDVREAYVNLVAAKAILNSLESEFTLLEELKNIAQKQSQTNDASEMDIIQADIALIQMATQVNNARSNVQNARYRFNKTLNVPPDNLIEYDSQDDTLDSTGNFINLMTPSPKSLLPDFKNISELAMNSRFDLKIAKKEIDTAKNNLSVVARQRIPDVELQAGYAFQSKGMSDDSTFKGGGYAGASLINLPFLYNYSPEIKNAKLEYDKAQLKYASAQNKAKQDINIAYERFVTAKLNLNYYEDNLLKSSKEMIKISKKSYEAGKSNLTSLIVMEQAYKSIMAGYTYALADYYNCWIDFLREVDVEEFNLNTENI